MQSKITVHSTVGDTEEFLKNFSKAMKQITYVTMPYIEKVIFQKTHTIVVWANGTRTVVNCVEEDFDKEKGLAMAIVKKYMNRNEFKRLIENAEIQEK